MKIASRHSIFLFLTCNINFFMAKTHSAHLKRDSKRAINCNKWIQHSTGPEIDCWFILFGIETNKSHFNRLLNTSGTDFLIRTHFVPVLWRISFSFLCSWKCNFTNGIETFKKLNAHKKHAEREMKRRKSHQKHLFAARERCSWHKCYKRTEMDNKIKFWSQRIWH